MLQLTTRQAEILAFVRDYAGEHGMPPTRAEIMAAFGFASPNAAQTHLRALARRGVIALTAGASRGIRLAAPAAGDTLPLIGRVAAGAPLLAVEHVEAHHRVDPALFSPKPDYLLKVRGESMIGAGIGDGDLLAVHACRDAPSGKIVVARLDDEVTVKRLRRERGRIRLEAANPAYAPIEVDARQALAIEGIAVGVLKRFNR